MNLKDEQIIVLGGDALASAAAIKLFRAGFRIVMFASLEVSYLRYHLSLGDALHVGRREVDGVVAIPLPEEKLAAMNGRPYAEKLAQTVTFVQKNRQIPVLDAREYEYFLQSESAHIVVDMRQHKMTAPELNIDDCRHMVGLYPFHKPGIDCHIAVETRLNYFLGRNYPPGFETPQRDIDSLFFNQPIVKCTTPIAGVWISSKSLGDAITVNEAVGKINEIEIRSPYAGQIWGLVHSGRFLDAKSDVASILEGSRVNEFRTLGFQDMAIAAGVLEAVLRSYATG